jgi:hypothetical protein
MSLIDIKVMNPFMHELGRVFQEVAMQESAAIN